MRIAREVTVRPASAVRGTVTAPGDKSISHRYALLAALAEGTSTLANYAPGADCASTLHCLEQLGVRVERRLPLNAADPPVVVIDGRGERRLTEPSEPLDCGNSGSTMRMLAGVVAAHPFQCTLMGDASLSRRPMRRIIVPLAAMGARIEAAGDCAPLSVLGGPLHGIDFAPDVPSAQVKSAVMLAGLQASGRTRITEAVPTRDHTERALSAFGAIVSRAGRDVIVDGHQTLRAVDARVPGDLSSAAFLAVAAASLPGSQVAIENVGLNPSRTAVLDVLAAFGAEVGRDQTDVWQAEPVGRIRVASAPLRPVELTAPQIPGVIDELPVLAVLATAGGGLRVTGAAELRVKESDRITALVSGLRTLGADAEELPDGFQIRPGRRLNGGIVEAHGDHRLAMAFAIAALLASGPVTIHGADAAAVSYPSFFSDLERLRA